jgi:LPS-assembly lipoprotein
MINRRVLLLLSLAPVLGACGFRPLYGGGENSLAAQGLSQISVQEQKTRAGQMLRNELLSARVGAKADNAPYVLALDVSETGKGRPGTKERVPYRMTTVYQLTDVASGKVVEQGKSYSLVSFDTVGEPLADLQAENAARQRAARELGQDIRTRLAARFAS